MWSASIPPPARPAWPRWSATPETISRTGRIWWPGSSAAPGVTADDVIQIAFGYGLFTGGFGLHYGAERLGASVIPISSGNTKRQIKIMQDFKTTALVCTPSYALKIADVMMEMGINPHGLSLQIRPVRRRTLVRGDAPGDQRTARHHRHRQLRAVRGHGTGRGR